MTVELVRVGEVLRAERTPVAPDPMKEFVAIGVRSFGKGIFHYEPRFGDQLGSLKFFDVQPHRLVVSNIKGWEGAIAVSAEADRGCVASNRFLQYVPQDDRIDVRWASWFFLSERGIELIQRASPGSADRNRTLAIERFEALEIPLPTLDHQVRVATKLDTVIDRVVTTSSLIERSNRLRHGLTDALVVQASKDAAEHEFGELFSLVRRPAEVCLEGSYEEIGLRSWGRGSFRKPPVSGADLAGKRVFEIRQGDLVISNVFGWEGAVAVASGDDDGLIGSHRFMTWVVAAPIVEAAWVASFLTTGEGISRLANASPGSAGRNRTLSVERLARVRVPVPSVEVQDRVARAIDRLTDCEPARMRVDERLNTVVPAALNEAFGGLS